MLRPLSTKPLKQKKGYERHKECGGLLLSEFCLTPPGSNGPRAAVNCDDGGFRQRATR